ncbi:MAG TPA: L-threonylcarbamoyladenylate synthase [Nitrosopumilaceae archaeon]|nr:L-threonylcarbamoyladenylate synthase [Nitrosopumilaceae archaeon]
MLLKYQTQRIKINSKNPEKIKIRKAAAIIKNGGIVAFPTETVYGLGANALNPQAVKKIFLAKKRPFDDPLIIHINDFNTLSKLALDISPLAKKIMKKYWPGPLTVILKKSKLVPKITTGKQKTVAIRMPNSKIALSLIKESGSPIAAPSANLFGKPSPTVAQHVLEDLDGKIDLVIDGGKTSIGLESTVLDLSSDIPVLLRPGKISYEELCKFGKIKLINSQKGKKLKNLISKSPGMKYKHYSPHAKIILVKGNPKKCIKKISNLIEHYHKKNKKVGIISTSKNTNHKADLTLFVGGTKKMIAKNLFGAFRIFDNKCIDVILIKEINNSELGFAIMNRLEKAAHRTVLA